MGLLIQNDKAAAQGCYLFCDNDSKCISLTADGVGAIRAGTGFNATADPVTPARSYSALCVNDVQVVFAQDDGVYPDTDIDPTYELGGDGNTFQSWLTVWSQRYATRVGAALASAATIAPTSGIHHVTGTTAISALTPPTASFTGDITLIMDNNCNLATGGNIDPAAVEAANLAATAASAVSGKAKVVLTFDGTTWY